MTKLTARQRLALQDAFNRPGGWGIFFPATTDKLGEHGFFERAKHPSYGMKWRLTPAGRAALSVQKDKGQ